MSTVVTEIPKATRTGKYDYKTLFNGEIHRLVQGEDFKVTPESVRGALYNRKALINKANPTEQIGLTVQFREEGGKKVVYVQKLDKKKKATTKKADRKPVKPTGK